LNELSTLAIQLTLKQSAGGIQLRYHPPHGIRKESPVQSDKISSRGDVLSRIGRRFKSCPADYVFLHGGGQGGWVWDETIAALRQQTQDKFGRAFVLDVPGCGSKRGKDTATLSIDGVATELLADISKQDLRNIILVGHSQAGTVLPRLAAKGPELFRKLVYVSAIAPSPGKNILQQMGTGPRGSNPEEVGWPFDPETIDASKRSALMFCNDMDEAATAAFLAKLGYDNWPAQTMAAADWRYDHLESIPSTYVICLRDGILPVQWQETFAARVKAKRQIRIDAGHQVMNTRPHTLAEVLHYEAI
jgi:pimeloyl-ACP methyl ester carboxylesterase